MDIYKEEVMDHYENPRNQGEVDLLAGSGQVQEGKDANASCGDMVQFQLKIEKGKIVEAKWKGIGCAITTAASSKLSVWLKGKDVAKVEKMSEEELVEKGVGFKVNPGREKCLTLPVRVVKKSLES